MRSTGGCCCSSLVNEVLLFLLISGEGSLSSVEWLPKKRKKSLTLPFASLTNQITQGYPTPALSPPTNNNNNNIHPSCANRDVGSIISHSVLFSFDVFPLAKRISVLASFVYLFPPTSSAPPSKR